MSECTATAVEAAVVETSYFKINYIVRPYYYYYYYYYYCCCYYYYYYYRHNYVFFCILRPMGKEKA